MHVARGSSANPGTRREVPAGSIVFWPGAGSDAVFLLESGLVSLQRLSPAGDSLGLCLVRPGELFGEEVLFDRPLQCLAEVLVPSAVRSIPARQLGDRLRRYPEEAWTLAAQLHGRGAQLMDRAEGLLARDACARLAGLLVELRDSLAQPGKAADAEHLPLTQTRLAALVGASRQTVNAVLGRLESDGLIARSQPGLRIRRVEALRALAAGSDDGARPATGFRCVGAAPLPLAGFG